MLVGPHGIWNGDVPPTIDAITDGTSNTLAVVEACGRNIVWNEPRDIDLATTPVAVNLRGKKRFDSPAMISSYHPGGAQVLLADGSVRFVSSKIDPKTLEALVTADGGEPIGDW